MNRPPNRRFFSYKFARRSDIRKAKEEAEAEANKRFDEVETEIVGWQKRRKGAD